MSAISACRILWILQIALSGISNTLQRSLTTIKENTRTLAPKDPEAAGPAANDDKAKPLLPDPDEAEDDDNVNLD